MPKCCHLRVSISQVFFTQYFATTWQIHAELSCKLISVCFAGPMTWLYCCVTALISGCQPPHKMHSLLQSSFPLKFWMSLVLIGRHVVWTKKFRFSFIKLNPVWYRFIVICYKYLGWSSTSQLLSYNEVRTKLMINKSERIFCWTYIPRNLTSFYECLIKPYHTCDWVITRSSTGGCICTHRTKLLK